MAASRRQQEKAHTYGLCIVCGTQSWERPIDPAHLCARGRGGCDSYFCVIPLCRVCHNGFDEGRLDIYPYLRPANAPRQWALELHHALMHYEEDMVSLLHRLTGARWVDLDAPEGLFDAG